MEMVTHRTGVWDEDEFLETKTIRLLGRIIFGYYDELSNGKQERGTRGRKGKANKKERKKKRKRISFFYSSARAIRRPSNEPVGLFVKGTQKKIIDWSGIWTRALSDSGI